MKAAVAVLLLVLAGCSDSPEQEDGSVMPGPSEDGGNGTILLLWDVNVSLQNPSTPSPPTAEGNEFPVGSFEVPANVTDIVVAYHRYHVSYEFFAANCRLYHEGDLVDQDAFSDAQLGNFDSEGDCVLSFASLAAGTYDAVYLADKWDPMGRHEIHVRVEATSA